MSLKNKRVLITSGPTWVSIDSVRVISNIATGETGILLAKEAKRLGAKVTLFLGPIDYKCRLNKAIKIKRFHFFDELKNKIIQELRVKKYDMIIHNAAVSDFKPQVFFKGKIDSGKGFNLELKPLPKLVKYIRRLAPMAKLAMFKLEPGLPDNTLIKRAKMAREKIGADFIVANCLNPYRAYVIDKKGNVLLAGSRNELAKKLIKILHLAPNTYNL